MGNRLEDHTLKLAEDEEEMASRQKAGIAMDMETSSFDKSLATKAPTPQHLNNTSAGARTHAR